MARLLARAEPTRSDTKSMSEGECQHSSAAAVVAPSGGSQTASHAATGSRTGNHGPTGPTDSASEARDENSQFHLLAAPRSGHQQVRTISLHAVAAELLVEALVVVSSGTTDTKSWASSSSSILERLTLSGDLESQGLRRLTGACIAEGVLDTRH